MGGVKTARACDGYRRGRLLDRADRAGPVGAAGDVVGPRLAPAALGFVTLFFGVGQALGPGIAGAMADASQSLAPAYLLAAGVAGLGAIGSVLLDKVIVMRASAASSSSV